MTWAQECLWGYFDGDRVCAGRIFCASAQACPIKIATQIATLSSDLLNMCDCAQFAWRKFVTYSYPLFLDNNFYNRYNINKYIANPMGRLMHIGNIAPDRPWLCLYDP